MRSLDTVPRARTTASQSASPSASQPAEPPAAPAATAGNRWTRLAFRADELVVLARRSLIHMRRRPALLLFLLVEPVLLVLLFRYVLGGAVGADMATGYADFMVPGVLVQTVTLGSVTIGSSLAQDLQSGMVDRFRSLPITRTSVLAGHAIAGVVRSSFVLLAMVLMGLLVGFRPTAGPLRWAGALALLLLFALAMAWIPVLIALLVGGVEMVESLGLSLLFPFTLVSSAFVPLSTMPGPLRAFAANQPLTAVIDAVRALVLDRPVHASAWLAVAWALGIIAVCVPAAGLAYRRSTAR